MITLLILILIIILSFTYLNKRPIKLLTILIFLRIILFLNIYSKSGQAWLPIVIFIIFSGGIIIIFIIVSSFLPNKNKGIIKKFLWLIIVLTLFFCINKEYTKECSHTLTIEFLRCYRNILILIFLIRVFFLGSILIISKSKTPIRSFVC